MFIYTFLFKWVYVRSFIKLLILIALMSYELQSYSQGTQLSSEISIDTSVKGEILYINPRVYNLQYIFELHPDSNMINPEKHLKVWIPVFGEWDEQNPVNLISVNPEPDGTFVDPEYGNSMLYWDFSKVAPMDSYVVVINYRLESFNVYTEFDSLQEFRYDVTNNDYQLNTRSTYLFDITPEVKKMTKEIVGQESNPYLKAKRIFDFVTKKMRYKFVRHTLGATMTTILDSPQKDTETGEIYYEGVCDHFSIFFVCLCRAAGIPARSVIGPVGWGPWITEDQLKLRSKLHTELTQEGFSATRLYGALAGHIWAEFYLPEYGWVPVDPTWRQFGFRSNMKLNFTKGRNLIIGPNAPQKKHNGYGDQWIPLHEGRVNAFGWGVWNIANIRVAKGKFLHFSDPFPADGYSEFANNLYPEYKAEVNVTNFKKDFILSLLTSKVKNGGIFTEENFVKDHWLNYTREAYLCQMLRQITGKENFDKIFQNYLDIRISEGRSISTTEFQEIAESYSGSSLNHFFEKIVNSKSLDQLGLEMQVDTLYTLIKQKDITSAVNSYNLLRDKYPEDFNFNKEQINRLALYLRNVNMFDESIIVYSWMMQLFPDWFEVYNGIADVYRYKGENKTAIKYYAKSLELNSDFDYAKEIVTAIEELSK